MLIDGISFSAIAVTVLLAWSLDCFFTKNVAIVFKPGMPATATVAVTLPLIHVIDTNPIRLS